MPCTFEKIYYKPDPKPTKEESQKYVHSTILHDVELALENGVLVGFEKSTTGKKNRDLVYKITIRQKDCLDEEP